MELRPHRGASLSGEGGPVSLVRGLSGSPDVISWYDTKGPGQARRQETHHTLKIHQCVCRVHRCTHHITDTKLG